MVRCMGRERERAERGMIWPQGSALVCRLLAGSCIQKKVTHRLSVTRYNGGQVGERRRVISRIECMRHLAFPASTTHSTPPTQNISHANVQVLWLHAGATWTKGERERDFAAVRRLPLTHSSLHSQTPQLSDLEENESNVSSFCRPTTEVRPD